MVFRRQQENRRRLDRKKKRVDRRTFWVGLCKRAFLILALLSVGFGLPFVILQGYHYTMQSDYFSLNYVEVEGLYYLEEESLLQAAEDIAGEHLFNVRPERLEAALASLPFVADVTVERLFPDRLYIGIVEYEPTAILVSDAFWLVDVHGEAFLLLDTPDPGHDLWTLPMISGLTRADLETREGKERLQTALRVHRLYKEKGLAETQPISEVHIDPLLGISLIVGDTGTEVRLGWGRIEERLERLEAVQTSLIRRGIDAAYVLLDQEDDLNRIAVGRRTGPGIGEVDESPLAP